MASSEKSSTSLFDVYLRLRPPTIESGDCFLEAEEPAGEGLAHITLQPPTTDHRRRAVEKFAFTKIFKEDATQKEVLDGTKLVPLVEGVLGSAGKTGRDGLLATLGVTGSGKVNRDVESMSTNANRVATESHYSWIEDSAWSYAAGD